MSKKDFNTWFNNFKTSIANYNYYIDFQTVYKNINIMRLKLNMLNSLVGSQNIEQDFKQLCKEYPAVVDVIPLLIAKRESEIYCTDQMGSKIYDFNFVTSLNKMSQAEIEQYLDDLVYFMKETGLFQLLQSNLINNVIDYAIGVEAGLNANARKNRGGKLMEDLVEGYIKKAGFILNKNYFKEFYLADVEREFNLNLDALSNDGQTAKRFDFVLKIQDTIYAIECNFYSSSGSKLNETARSYKTLALEAQNIPNFKFVWITDGLLGWKNARNNLKETFDIMEHIYNISELENGLFEKLKDHKEIKP
ncbi:type II restriction endonuclease [Mycoplasma sp. VS410B]|uniref:type II restriction endonuclease n=1 Tax=Mycoplasma sp. VS410B TaxID=3401688 RepID=UPI003AB09680